MKKSGIRVTVDDTNDSLSKKIRNAETEHVNYIVVVGEKESSDHTLAVRNYKTKGQSTEKVGDFVEKIRGEVATRAL